MTPPRFDQHLGRSVFAIFATLSDFERDLIHKRTVAGLAGAIHLIRFALRKVQIGPSFMYTPVANFSLRSAFAMRN